MSCPVNINMNVEKIYSIFTFCQGMNCHFHVAEVSPSYISFHLIEAHTVAQAEIPGYDMIWWHVNTKDNTKHKTWDMYAVASGLYPAG